VTPRRWRSSVVARAGTRSTARSDPLSAITPEARVRLRWLIGGQHSKNKILEKLYNYANSSFVQKRTTYEQLIFCGDNP
jgi:hypothetical protein